MSHNLRTRVDLAAWSDTNAPVLPAEIDQIDRYAYQSINGDTGGIWAPSTAITIGGAGMVITGLLWIQGISGLLSYAPAQFNNTVTILNTLTVTGGLLTANSGIHVTGAPLTVDTAGVFNSTLDVFDDVTLHTSADLLVGGSAQLGNDATKTLDVEATATFNAPVTLNGTLDVFGATTLHTAGLFTAGGNSVLGNDASKTLTVNATTTFASPITINGLVDAYASVILHGSANLNVNGTMTAQHDAVLGTTSADTIDVPGTLNLHTCMAFSFAGRVPCRPILASDADHIYAVSDGNEIFYSNDISADRHLTLDPNGAKTGDCWTVTLPNHGGGNGSLLTIGDGTSTICFLRATNGNFAIARIRYVSGSWHCFYKT